jgi:hypothetical protein
MQASINASAPQGGDFQSANMISENQYQHQPSQEPIIYDGASSSALHATNERINQVSDLDPRVATSIANTISSLGTQNVPFNDMSLAVPFNNTAGIQG